MQLLTSLQLATERDIAACDRIVERLSQNLPDFDSVWIDALVQRRIITPWQADCLNSPDPDQLRVGAFLKTVALGRHTFHAITPQTGRQVVLHGVVADTDGSDQHLQWLHHQLSELSNARTTTPASLEIPHAIPGDKAPADTPSTFSGYAGSTFVPGWTGDELLIRGGRIPWPAVAEIGRQLLEACAWMEQHNVVHGEITLKNVRLSPTGRTVLVSPLLNSMARHGISLTADLQLRDVEFLAPERVSTGNAADQCSELYSAGCVLWQLLTARPPFLQADPVNKVLASQQKDVTDVRQLVPDVPAWLARLLQSLTRRTPELRLSSATEAFQQWQQHAPTTTHQTRRLLSKLPDRSLRRGRAPAKRSSFKERTASVAVAATMIAGFAMYGVRSGLLPQPLTIGGRSANASALDNGRLTNRTTASHVAKSDQTQSPPTLSASGRRVLPQPDAAGVVVLESGVAYEASDLEFVGVMHIETTDARVALVHTEPNQPWRISASQIAIRNVEVRASGSGNQTTDRTADQPAAAVDCRCDVLSIKDCRFDSGSGGNRDRSVLWTPHEGHASVVSVSNSVFHGSGYGLWMTSSPQRCELTNVLITNQRAGVRCDVHPATNAAFKMTVDRVTQVGGLNFLDAVVPTEKPKSLRVQMTCGESVLAVSGALVQVAAPKNWPLKRATVECLLPQRGNPTIIPPGVRTAVGFDSGLNAVVALQESQVRAEALLIAEPIFRGTSAHDDAANDADTAWQLLNFEGPKLSLQMPGVDVTMLPQLFDGDIR